ncbi:Predicted integral membrane protein [uncultured Clostridium sp.]|uniref:VanZ family protein n=1 Tax=uncultured Clostridium sp. TaxID=59620 RepID=UPI000820FC0B|nr:VanZ family protein [uncultured Clostridium sp.]SCJ60757.1 Predicted integral membrane protein [uncultured Clostridium sp.]
MIGISYIYFLIVSIILWLIYRFISHKKHHKITILREIFINLFFIYFLMIIYFTFFKGGILHLDLQMRSYANIIPLVETIKMFQNNFMGLGNSLYNVLGNILLFFPFGFAIPLLFENHNKLFKVTLYGFIASFSIELLQYLTCTNFTDIDDVIFNTVGTLIGFLIFNLFIFLVRKTTIIYWIKRIRKTYDGSLIFLSSRFLLPLTLCTVSLFFGILYSSTISGNLSDEEIATAVFNYNTEGNYVATEQFFNHKIFLQDNGEYLDLKIADEVLNNRYVQGYSRQLTWSENSYGYSVALISEDDGSTGVIVFGKNNDAKTIEITLNNNVYSTFISPNSFFIITYPTFQILNDNSDIYNIYSTGEAKDLKITFNEDDKTKCKHMKFLK